MEHSSIATTYEAMHRDVKLVYDLVGKISQHSKEASVLISQSMKMKVNNLFERRMHRKTQELAGLDRDDELQASLKIDVEVFNERQQIQSDYNMAVSDLEEYLYGLGCSLKARGEELCKSSSNVRSGLKGAEGDSSVSSQTDANIPQGDTEAKRSYPAPTATTEIHSTEKPRSSFPIPPPITMDLDTQGMIDAHFGSNGNQCEIVEDPESSEKRYILYCNEHHFNPTSLSGSLDQTQQLSLDRAVEHLQKEHKPLAKPYGYREAIDLMGVRMEDCTAEAQSQHNAGLRNTMSADTMQQSSKPTAAIPLSAESPSQHWSGTGPKPWHIHAVHNVENEYIPILIMDLSRSINDCLWFDADDKSVFKSQLARSPPGVDYDAQLGRFKGWTDAFQEGQPNYSYRWYPAIVFNGPTFKRDDVFAAWVNFAKVSAFSQRYVTDRTRAKWEAAERFRVSTSTKKQKTPSQETEKAEDTRLDKIQRTEHSTSIPATAGDKVSLPAAESRKSSYSAHRCKSSVASEHAPSPSDGAVFRWQVPVTAIVSKRKTTHAEEKTSKRVRIASPEVRNNEAPCATQQLLSAIQFGSNSEKELTDKNKPNGDNLGSEAVSNNADDSNSTVPVSKPKEPGLTTPAPRPLEIATRVTNTEAKDNQPETQKQSTTLVRGSSE